MNDFTPAATAWLADHHGVINAAELRRAEVGRHTTERLVRRGVLRTDHKGVYVLASTRPTMEQRCAVLSAAHPRGFVTGPTAGIILRLRRMPRTAPLNSSVRHGVHLANEPGVRYRQTTALRASHRTLRADGIAVARPDRLGFDLAGDLALLDLISVLHQLLAERRVTMSDLIGIANELCHPARDGSRRFAEALDRLGSGPPADSHPEVELAEALRSLDVPVECQAGVATLDGRVLAIDLAVPAVRWGIELDVHPEHRSLEGHAGTVQRLRDLQHVDWRVEPVSELDVRDVGRLARELAAAYRKRRDQLTAEASVTCVSGHRSRPVARTSWPAGGMP